MTSRRRKRNSRHDSSVPSQLHLQNHHIFALTLAAYLNRQNPFSQSLIKTLLRIQLERVRQSPASPEDALPDPILCVLPLLLRTGHGNIVVASASVVGAAALTSFEANERIASEKELMDGLVGALLCRRKKVLKAVMNAILDLSTTSIGRERLWESSAVEKLMSLFCRLSPSSSIKAGALSYKKRESTNRLLKRLIQDELVALVLDSVLTLVNTSSLDHLEKIPRDMTAAFLVHAKDLHSQLSASRELCYFKTCDLAEAIFRLSLNNDYHPTYTCDVIRKVIFGTVGSGFANFMLNYWEEEPFLVRSSLNMLGHDGYSLYSLLLDYNCGTIDSTLDSILVGLVSCPPIASDELSILDFLKEAKHGLGSPVVYGQDIRVVKTGENLYGELHFFSDRIGPNDVSVEKCKEAYYNGYTIAIRGMEFRSEKIASIAVGLAELFGQPSVGANIYLTPPQSQGLARHYDDHCVFVCQLIGSKKWMIFPRREGYLPRLYESLSLQSSVGGGDAGECRQVLLKEGEILYIPRGFPHEAHTVTDELGAQPDDNMNFSLHLTLGIEVEPLLEWEGFAHVALCSWEQNQTAQKHDQSDSTLSMPNILLVYLLHISIKLIADRDPTFRKACLVVASTLPLLAEKETLAALNTRQRIIFAGLIAKIESQCNFFEALKSVEVAVHKENGEPCQWLKWLMDLDQERSIVEETSLHDSMKAFRDLLLVCNRHIEQAESDFLQIKMDFCRNVVFDEVLVTYRKLIQKYKKTREQYMRGMLALHYNKQIHASCGVLV